MEFFLDNLFPIVFSFILAILGRYGVMFIQIGTNYLKNITNSQELESFIIKLESLILSAYQTLIKELKEEYKENPSTDVKETLELAKKTAKVVVTNLATELLKEAPEFVQTFIGDKLDHYIESTLVIVKKKLKGAETNTPLK